MDIEQIAEGRLWNNNPWEDMPDYVNYYESEVYAFQFFLFDSKKDICEDSPSINGVCYICDEIEHADDLTGSDAARWLKLTKAEKAESLKKLGAQTPELVPTQELRQERFDNWQSTYDHVMVIYGIARDQNGREYYKVKNSWGKTGDYQGIWYMSKAYIALNTTYIFVNKDAMQKGIRKKLGF